MVLPARPPCSGFAWSSHKNCALISARRHIAELPVGDVHVDLVQEPHADADAVLLGIEPLGEVVQETVGDVKPESLVVVVFEEQTED